MSRGNENDYEMTKIETSIAEHEIIPTAHKIPNQNRIEQITTPHPKMFPMCKSILIVAEGSSNIIERYAILAAALSEVGYRVRFLSHIEHQPLFEKMSDAGTGTTFEFVPMKRSQYEDPDFIALMKNMSPELQHLVINDPRLQVAMAKFDSDQFIQLTKSMIESREMCSSVLDELAHCQPDLIIAGHQCEYFGIYLNQMRNIPCINLSMEPSFLRQGNQQQLARWTSLDNSMASLGLPRILSNSPGASKVNKMTVIDELQRIHCLPLDIDEQDLVRAVAESTGRIAYEHYTDVHDIAKTGMLLSATN